MGHNCELDKTKINGENMKKKVSSSQFKAISGKTKQRKSSIAGPKVLSLGTNRQIHLHTKRIRKGKKTVCKMRSKLEELRPLVQDRSLCDA